MIRVYKKEEIVTSVYAVTIIIIKAISVLESSAVKPVASAGVITLSISICIYTVDTKLPTELNRIKNNA